VAWQMCVVNDKQVSPIWINQNTLIRIRASLPAGMYARRLFCLNWGAGTLMLHACLVSLCLVGSTLA
jgi:hypothetical protein